MGARVPVVAVVALTEVTATPPRLETLTVLLLALGIFTTATCWQMRGVADLSNAHNAKYPLSSSQSTGPTPLLASDVCTYLCVFRCVHAVCTAAPLRIARHPVLQTVTVALRTTIVMAITLNLTFFDPRCNQHGARLNSWCLSILGHQPRILSDEKGLRRGLQRALAVPCHSLVTMINRLF